jgi:hypothetical protein
MDSAQKGIGIGIVEAREIAGRGNVMILPEACCSLDVGRVYWDIGAVFFASRSSFKQVSGWCSVNECLMN